MVRSSVRHDDGATRCAERVIVIVIGDHTMRHEIQTRINVPHGR